MDPVSAFSLAGTILQFVDSGSRFVRLVYQLYHSDTDGHSSLSELEELAKGFNVVLKDFKSSRSTHSSAQSQHEGLAQLAGKCEKAVEELLTILRTLNISSHGRKMASLKLALQTTWREDEIKSLTLKIDTLRDQFNFHLLASLRNYAMQNLSKQDETLRLLGIASQNSSRLEGIAASILDFLASKAALSTPKVTANLKDALISKIYEEGDQSVDNNAHSIALNPERRLELHELILTTLKYDGMEDRESRIAETYGSTFQWAFRDSESETQTWHNLKKWLEDEDQIFWITGKAGSGKSTLMKYICQPALQSPGSDSSDSQPGSSDFDVTTTRTQSKRRCQPYLDKWAGHKKLLVASFYFWNSGTQIQMARRGLLRSLLYQLVQEKPELVPRAFPSRWESLSILGWQPNEWQESELQSALELFVRAATVDCRICFFIDGLDESDGAHEELIHLVQNLAHRNPNVKLCVASRPWVLFEDAFKTKAHLRLEDLTYSDIKHYVSSNFQSNSEFSKLRTREPEYANQLIENVVSKASGVFLWVHLVVASLLSGMSFGDRVQDLQSRLDYLPPDLENLYDKMLRSLDPFYLEHAAQYVKIMEASPQPLPVILFYFADQSAESVIKMPIGRIPEDALCVHLDAMNRRLNSRWKGLLEVGRATEASSSSDPASQTVQYLHRTVKDFIQSSKVQAFLQASLKSPFDPHLSLCVGYCACVKALLSPHGPATCIRSCLRHAALVLSKSEETMFQVLDSLATTLPPSDLGLESSPYFTTDMDFFPESGYAQRINYQYLFGDTFLSLAVVHDVLSYVKARAEKGCLVSTLDDGGRSIGWPLLVDAVLCGHPNPEMVECMLDMKADPNSVVPTQHPKTAWTIFLESIERGNGSPFNYELSITFRLIAKTMVTHGANLDVLSKYPTSYIMDLFDISLPKLKLLQLKHKFKRKGYHRFRRG